MGNVLIFAPRRVAPAPALPPALAPAEIRQRIEEAAQSALDTADRLIALLDRMDGDTDREDGGDAEPSLGAPENHHAAQFVWLRGCDSDGED